MNYIYRLSGDADSHSNYDISYHSSYEGARRALDTYLIEEILDRWLDDSNSQDTVYTVASREVEFNYDPTKLYEVYEVNVTYSMTGGYRTTFTSESYVIESLRLED